MDKRWKALIAIATVAYVICPDLFAGPVDDIVAIIIGYLATTNKINQSTYQSTYNYKEKDK